MADHRGANWCLLMGIALLLAGAAGTAAAVPPDGPAPRHPDGGQQEHEDFGWWQAKLRNCRLLGSTLPPAMEGSADSRGLATGCDQLRLDQRVRGLMRISFLRFQPMQAISAEKVVFVGLLEQGSQPMRCRQGRCQPQWPLRVRVSVVSEARFGPMGLATGLPTTHLARGTCHLTYPMVQCRATSPDGGEWQAAARLGA
jgi:hypothetical protein